MQWTGTGVTIPVHLFFFWKVCCPTNQPESGGLKHKVCYKQIKNPQNISVHAGFRCVILTKKIPAKKRDFWVQKRFAFIFLQRDFLIFAFGCSKAQPFFVYCKAWIIRSRSPLPLVASRKNGMLYFVKMASFNASRRSCSGLFSWKEKPFTSITSLQVLSCL